MESKKAHLVYLYLAIAIPLLVILVTAISVRLFPKAMHSQIAPAITTPKETNNASP